MPPWLQQWWRNRGRPRTSTLVLSALFLATLVVYFLVRPIQSNHHAPQRRVTVVIPSISASVTATPSNSVSLAGPVDSAAPSTARSGVRSASGSTSAPSSSGSSSGSSSTSVGASSPASGSPTQPTATTTSP